MKMNMYQVDAFTREVFKGNPLFFEAENRGIGHIIGNGIHLQLFL